MTRRPFKIGIAGTHSTGKSTFIAKVEQELRGDGLRVIIVGDLATCAQKRGFPILTGHTFESTLWIMAECMRQEAEASLTADIILVDRPPPTRSAIFALRWRSLAATSIAGAWMNSWRSRKHTWVIMIILS